MPRFLEKHQKRQTLTADPARLQLLAEWIYYEISDALSSRHFTENTWREVLKMYEGVPKLETRDVPIENAPNIEVTIGAMAADTIYAQSIDLMFNTSPLVTVRPKPNFKDDKLTVQKAKDTQVFVNHLATSPEVDLRNAVETSVLDDVQLGTGLLYVPWVEKTKKTRTAKILSRGPRIRAMAPEDVIVPGGTRQCMDEMSLLALCFYPTTQELADLARTNSWDLTHFQPMGATGWVRSRREILGKHQEGVMRKGQIFDLHLVFCYFDIDGDGYDEDLMVIYNHTGRAIAAYSYNSMDRRPTEIMVYQRRAHMFYGMGVLEMMQPFEEKLSDVHNYSTLNLLLANSRVWAGDGSAPENLQIWPGKVITGLSNSDSLKPLGMADVYNSIWQEQIIIMQLANKRVGINDAVSPQGVPSRTPGMTTISMLQQVNRRFTPAYDSMRICVANALSQCLYRYQERILAGDRQAMESIFAVVGYEAGMNIVDMLQNESFDEQVDIELTAASASTNRESDRQNAIMLTNMLAQYYQRTLELMAIASSPETPEAVRSVATKIASAASEIIDRTVRTFDQVRDPSTFVVEVDAEMQQLQAQTSATQDTLNSLFTALAGEAPQGGPLELPERTMV